MGAPSTSHRLIYAPRRDAAQFRRGGRRVLCIHVYIVIYRYCFLHLKHNNYILADVACMYIYIWSSSYIYWYARSGAENARVRRSGIFSTFYRTTTHI